jgi:MFS family permease
VLESNRTERTYRYELWRAGSSGILETAGSTFLLLIAVRYYHAGALAKGLLAAGTSVGMLLSPLVVSAVTTAGWRTSQAAARILAFGAVALCLAGTFSGLTAFVIGSVAGMAATACIVPLLTQMYQENYPENDRGRRFSRTVMIRIAVAAIFSKVAGDLLPPDLKHFQILLWVFGAALAFGSFCLNRCPTRAIQADGSAHPFRAWRFVLKDRLFRYTLICWMLMGFANLMMVPLRVEYLANPQYNLALTAGLVALLTGVIPNIARLVLSPVWGWLFDRVNFFGLRVALNIGFGLGIITFFMSNSMPGLIGGAIIFGISNAGGDVAWSLWVTKFAPPDRVADYMSIHTFLTGLRGVVAPLLAFSLASPSSLGTLATVSVSLTVAATLMLLPELKSGRKTRPGQALVEEISE